MSPRERFDRLYDRVMSAAERGDTATVVRFAPMAKGAYQQLDTVDVDARYHAAMIHLALGETGEALALADTIAKTAPSHLFLFMIRGDAARMESRIPDLRRAYADFLRYYPGEMRAARAEYREHRPVLEDFRTHAEQAVRLGAGGKPD
jgi:hypothetical protein